MNSDYLTSFARRIEQFIDWSGRTIAWLTLGMVLVTCTVVVFRYAFDLGWIWLQESISYMHAFVFMLGAAYTFRHNDHVRVDIFYHRFTARRKAMVDLAGSALLVLPVCAFIFLNSWDNVYESWTRLEGSEETGGLDLVYVLKTCMLLMPVMLALQAIAIITRNTLILREVIEPPAEYQQGDTHG